MFFDTCEDMHAYRVSATRSVAAIFKSHNVYDAIAAICIFKLRFTNDIVAVTLVFKSLHMHKTIAATLRVADASKM